MKVNSTIRDLFSNTERLNFLNRYSSVIDNDTEMNISEMIDTTNIYEYMVVYDGERLMYQKDYGLSDKESHTYPQDDIIENNTDYTLLDTSGVDITGKLLLSHGHYLITMSENQASIIDIVSEDDIMSINSTNSSIITFNESISLESVKINAGYIYYTDKNLLYRIDIINKTNELVKEFENIITTIEPQNNILFLSFLNTPYMVYRYDLDTGEKLSETRIRSNINRNSVDSLYIIKFIKFFDNTLYVSFLNGEIYEIYITGINKEIDQDYHEIFHNGSGYIIDSIYNREYILFLDNRDNIIFYNYIYDRKEIYSIDSRIKSVSISELTVNVLSNNHIDILNLYNPPTVRVNYFRAENKIETNNLEEFINTNVSLIENEMNNFDRYKYSIRMRAEYTEDNIEDKDTQSGTEIYTDKADDSVVHVEVDGKSVQDGEPTPDAPVEIVSLNDFDVVSSVGGRNLLKGTAGFTGDWEGKDRWSLEPDSINGLLIYSRSDTFSGVSTAFRVTKGQEYTFSFYGKADIDTSVNVYFHDVDPEDPPVEDPEEPVDEEEDPEEEDPEEPVDPEDPPVEDPEEPVDKEEDPDEDDPEEPVDTVNNVTQPHNQTVELNDEFKRISVSFIALESTVIKPRVEKTVNDSNKIYVAGYKLELGNKATDWTPAPEDITESDNHSPIDKITLHLNEPLRSVGDVKDRLFRDTDGLWKVERNVEVTGTEDGTMSITDAYSPYDVPVIEVLSDAYQKKLNNLRSFANSNYVYTVSDLQPTLHATFKDIKWDDPIYSVTSSSVNINTLNYPINIYCRTNDNNFWSNFSRFNQDPEGQSYIYFDVTNKDLDYIYEFKINLADIYKKHLPVDISKIEHWDNHNMDRLVPYLTYRNEIKEDDFIENYTVDNRYDEEDVKDLGNILNEKLYRNVTLPEVDHHVKGDFPNFSPSRYFNMNWNSTGINNKKTETLYSDIYVNGKKIFKSDSLQRDLFNGSLRNYIEKNAVERFMTPSSFRNLINNNRIDSNTSIISVLKRRNLASSEKFIHRVTINNEYEDQSNLIATTGLFVRSEDLKNIDIRNLRVYINLVGDEYHRRLNPYMYNLYYDENYELYKLTINGFNLEEGTEVVISHNGLTNGNIVYDKLNYNSEIVDSLPIIEIDEYGDLITEVDKSVHDVEVVVDGLTLIPNYDYIVINPKSVNIPSLIAFRNIIPNDSKVEITLFEDNSTHTVYIPFSNEDSIRRFSITDDIGIFIDKHFEVFADNHRVSKENIKIINHRTIEILPGYNGVLANVMIRFNSRNYVNTNQIIATHKYDIIDMNDESYYNTYQEKIESSFDILTDNKASNSISKIMLYDELNSMRHEDSTGSEETFIINANNTDLQWNIPLSSDEIYNNYIKENIVLDMNTSRKNYRDDNEIINPEI